MNTQYFQREYETGLIFYSMKVGENIKKLRKLAGLTQVELAEKLGVSQQAVTDWERGYRKPNLEKIPEIAKTLDVSIEELFSGISANNKKPKQRVHKNSRSIKIQELFEKLPSSKQENVFQLVKGLVS